MRLKYLVGGKGFRFLCDASEWSYQLSRKWLEDAEETYEDIGILEVREIGGKSYGVYDKVAEEFLIEYPIGNYQN